MPETKLPPKLPNRTFDNAEIIFRNFAGRKQQYNEEGNRNFCIVLEPDLADMMEKDGWNVKSMRVRDEGDVPDRYIQVKVNFNSERPPKVIMIAGPNRLALGPDEVAVLDFAELSNVDVTLNPYAWDFNGKQGVTAYLKTIFATQALDELDLKYGAEDQSALPMSSLGEGDALTDVTLGDDELGNLSDPGPEES